tara:strand:- start:356 stop:607 length:252 start_codon:yes stop_codon:yes gene_type:complete
MCFPTPPKPAPPPPLAPPPPPPAPPAPPLPSPDPLVTEVNPAVRRAKSKKDKNPLSKGTGALRISLNQGVNQPTTPAGGLNNP